MLGVWEQWCRRNGVKPVAVTRDHIAAWLLERHAKVSPATVRNSLIGLRSYYRHLIDSRLRRTNPSVGFRGPKVELPPVEPYSQVELLALLEAGRKPRDRAMLLLLVGSGLRASELLKIRLEDVDLAVGTILIHGKGRKKRLVAPGKAAMLALEDYLGSRSDNIWQSGLDSYSGLRQWIERLGVRADVRGATLHRLRHTFACGFLRAGGTEGQLQHLLGHKSLAMSLHYADGARAEVALEAQRELDLGARLVG